MYFFIILLKRRVRISYFMAKVFLFGVELNDSIYRYELENNSYSMILIVLDNLRHRYELKNKSYGMILIVLDIFQR